MKYELTPEQIGANWEEFQENIKHYVSGERGDKLLKLYQDIEEHIVLAPAAITKSNHNCIPGGYVDHINRVVKAAFELKEVWSRYGAENNFTDEELAFVCINHDLGKLGLPGTPGCFPNDNDWEVQKLGKIYKYNTALTFSTVPDRTLFILQSRSITITENEYLGIKLHDGLYDESNKPYLASYQPESRLRSYLPLLVHQADMLASRVEWEKEWLPRLNQSSVDTRPRTNTSTPTAVKQKPSQAALKKLGAHNPGILAALKNIE